MASASCCEFCATAAAGKAAATASTMDGRIDCMVFPFRRRSYRQARARTWRRNFETGASIPCSLTGEKAPKDLVATVAELPQLRHRVGTRRGQVLNDRSITGPAAPLLASPLRRVVARTAAVQSLPQHYAGGWDMPQKFELAQCNIAR